MKELVSSARRLSITPELAPGQETESRRQEVATSKTRNVEDALAPEPAPEPETESPRQVEEMDERIRSAMRKKATWSPHRIAEDDDGEEALSAPHAAYARKVRKHGADGERGLHFEEEEDEEDEEEDGGQGLGASRPEETNTDRLSPSSNPRATRKQRVTHPDPFATFSAETDVKSFRAMARPIAYFLGAVILIVGYSILRAAGRAQGEATDRKAGPSVARGGRWRKAAEARKKPRV